MKKTLFVVLIIGLALLFGACNTSGGPDGGKEGDGKDVEWTVDYLLDTLTGDDFPGGEIDLSDRGLLDISAYASVTVEAILYTDTKGETVAVLPTTGDDKSLAQFTLLKASGNWDTTSNICGVGDKQKDTKYNMVVNGNSVWNVPSGASGVPAKLLIQANHKTIDEGLRVNSIKVKSIAFTAKTGNDPVVFDWGSVETEDFPTNTEWPGKSLPLDGASTITGELGDMSLYKEVIVDAVVYDRAGNIATATDLIDQAFFVLVTDNSNWTTYETVKQYDMAVNGTTSVNPDNNKVEDENKAWKGTPTWIVFMGQYKSGESNNKMVGKVALKSITFVPK